MNWQNLPLNISKQYITARLYGGCDIFVPVINDSKIEADYTRKRLQDFIAQQNYYLSRPPPGQGPITA